MAKTKKGTEEKEPKAPETPEELAEKMRKDDSRLEEQVNMMHGQLGIDFADAIKGMGGVDAWRDAGFKFEKGYGKKVAADMYQRARGLAIKEFLGYTGGGFDPEKEDAVLDKLYETLGGIKLREFENTLTRKMTTIFPLAKRVGESYQEGVQTWYMERIEKNMEGMQDLAAKLYGTQGLDVLDPRKMPPQLIYSAIVQKDPHEAVEEQRKEIAEELPELFRYKGSKYKGKDKK